MSIVYHYTCLQAIFDTVTQTGCSEMQQAPADSSSLFNTWHYQTNLSHICQIATLLSFSELWQWYDHFRVITQNRYLVDYSYHLDSARLISWLKKMEKVKTTFHYIVFNVTERQVSHNYGTFSAINCYDKRHELCVLLMSVTVHAP